MLLSGGRSITVAWRISIAVSPAAQDRDPAVRERAFPRLVLERLADRQAADRAIGPGGHGQRGATELMVARRRASASAGATPFGIVVR